MSKRITAIGEVKDGKLHIIRERVFLDLVSRFNGPVRLTLEKETRTLAQNALYWLWNGIVGRELGWDAEDVHEYNKTHYNARTLSYADRVTGELRDEKIGATTTRLSKDAFSEFMERVERGWAAEGIALPDSEEDYCKSTLRETMP